MKIDKSVYTKIFAMDLDGVLAEGSAWTPDDCLKAKPIIENIEITNKLFKKYFVVIYTARIDELIPATLEWLRRNNVRYHAISNIKMCATLYCDDKAIDLKKITL